MAIVLAVTVQDFCLITKFLIISIKLTPLLFGQKQRKFIYFGNFSKIMEIIFFSNFIVFSNKFPIFFFLIQKKTEAMNFGQSMKVKINWIQIFHILQN